MYIAMLRTVLLYALILAAMRIMGKRQISQLQTSDLVVTLLLSELAVLPIEKKDESIIEGVAPMVMLVLFELLIVFLMLKSDKFRTLVCGKPAVVIDKGKINQKNMRKLRMTTEELMEHLRQKDVFFLEDVEYAIIETNGSMSIAKKTEVSPVTPKQSGIKVKPAGIEVVVISDGCLAKESIKLIGKDENWVMEKVREAKMELKQVFIMVTDTNGQFRIIPREI